MLFYAIKERVYLVYFSNLQKKSNFVQEIDQNRNKTRRWDTQIDEGSGNCLISSLHFSEMPIRLNDENEGTQSQIQAKLTLQELEENSIEQLFAQSRSGFKETLENLLTVNNAEIARLTNISEKILECLDKIEQQEESKVSFWAFWGENRRKAWY